MKMKIFVIKWKIRNEMENLGIDNIILEKRPKISEMKRNIMEIRLKRGEIKWKIREIRWKIWE